MKHILESRRLVVVILSIVTLIWVSCAHQDKRTAEVAHLKGPMRGLAVTIKSLLPKVTSYGQFTNSKNRDFITTRLKTLRNLSEEIQMEVSKEGQDPGMEAVVRDFQTDLRQASLDFSVGNYSKARWRVLNITSSCNTCHSRSSNDYGLSPIKWNIDYSTLNPSESIELMLAIKEYEKAFQFIGKTMQTCKSPFVEGLFISLKKSLAVSVRVLRNYDVSKKLLEQGISSRCFSKTQRKFLGSWKKSLSILDRYSMTYKQVYKKGQNLSQRSNELSFIYDLEGSARIHRYLNRFNRGVEYAESLYYAGIYAKRLSSISHGPLDHAYFESCIRHQPNSLIARKCYRKIASSYKERGLLNQSIYANHLNFLWKQSKEIKKPLHEEFKEKEEVEDEIRELLRIYTDEI